MVGDDPRGLIGREHMNTLWRALEQPFRVDALCAQMVAQFAGDAATIARETRAFLARLLARGLAMTAA